MSAILPPLFSQGYNPERADEGSFVELDTSTETDYPSAIGWGKYARLIYVIGVSAIPLEWNMAYNPERADEGSFVELDTSTETDYPSATGWGKYARLVYIVGLS